MELTGEQKLALPRERVWDALNDPDILKRCLPGCDVFDREADDRYKVGMVASVGPVKARFNGKLTLSDIVPPTSYALAFEGSGGAAGFGKGNAKVTLSDADAGGTTLRYAVEAQVGGKLAQVGARLIDGVAKKMADEFFTRFAKAVSPEGGAAAASAASTAGSSAAMTAQPAAAIGASPTAPSSASAPPPKAAPVSGAPAAAQAAVPTFAPAPTTAAMPAAPTQPVQPPAPAWQPAPVVTTAGDATVSRNIAVLAAAISAIGACVAVLAACVAMFASH